ncbi:MAG TPA: tautomerase family protein [Solirubrobacterales bacterium]|nr:tautomerase family protein [Solirubrobacterales bacterium]
MPIIEVKAFERRFEDPETAERLIAKLTDALCDVYGEELRAETWVLLEGVAPAHWGFGGEVRS